MSGEFADQAIDEMKTDLKRLAFVRIARSHGELSELARQFVAKIGHINASDKFRDLGLLISFINSVFDEKDYS